MPLLVKYRAEFKKLEGAATVVQGKPAHALVSQVRAALNELAAERRQGLSDDEAFDAARDVLLLQAEYAHEKIEMEEGPQAGAVALRKLREPELLTIQ